MEGRRVSRKSQKYNPLFIVFMCMFAAVIIMLILSIVLSVRLGSANKKLKAATDQVTQLEQEVEQLQSDLAAARDRMTADEDEPTVSPEDANKPAQAPEEHQETAPDANSWLDLAGHSEVQVKPTKLLDSYQTYYTTAGVNLRGGPATSYTKITTVDRGEKVQVAARDGNWSFVKAGNRFGWINSDYLSATQPAPETSTPAASTSGTKRAEATSSNLRRQ